MENKKYPEGIRPRRGKKPDRWSILVDFPRDPLQPHKRNRKWLKFDGTLTEAKKYRREILHNIDQGINVLSSDTTFGEYGDDYITSKEQEGKAVRTIESYRQMFNSHIKPVIGSIPINLMQPQHIKQYYEITLKKAKRNSVMALNPRTVNKHGKLIKQILQQAVREGIILRNVADQVITPGGDPKDPTVLSLKQIAQFMETAKSYPMQFPLYAAYAIAIYSGVRRGEVLGLRWSDLDMERGIISISETVNTLTGEGVVQGKPKSKRSRRLLIMAPQLRDILLEHRFYQGNIATRAKSKVESDDLVFQRPDGTPVRPGYFSRTFKRIALKVGLPDDATPHSLRHSFATHMAGMGVDPALLSAMMGHHSPSFTMGKYVHPSLGLQKQAMEMYAGALEPFFNFEKVEEKV